MANYTQLIKTINDNIKANGNQEITGPKLNSVLNLMVNVMKEADGKSVASESVRQIASLTQQEYDALETKDENTMYVIVEGTGDASE